jgi:hypothetical protein
VNFNCGRCGTQNTPGRVFCARCGQKLDLSDGPAARPSRFSLFGLIQNLLTILLVAALGLILWPVQPQGETGEPKDAVLVNQKLKAIAKAVDEKLFYGQVITEKEINAWFSAKLQKPAADSAPAWNQLTLDTIRVQLQADHLTLLVLTKWGSIPLSYELTGVPAIQDGKARLTVTHARWGHLPLPPQAQDWLTGRLAVMFAGMQKEQELLNQLARIDLAANRVRLLTKDGVNP